MASLSLSTFVFISVTLALLNPSLAVNLLHTDDSLYGGQSIIEGSYTFSMQTDCNLVLYENGRDVIWSSGTARKAINCKVVMQSDGNLVIYSGDGTAVWASNTSRSRAHYVLVLQRDRNVVIYGPAIWSTGTNRPGTAGVTISVSRNSTKPRADVIDGVSRNSTKPGAAVIDGGH